MFKQQISWLKKLGFLFAFILLTCNSFGAQSIGISIDSSTRNSSPTNVNIRATAVYAFGFTSLDTNAFLLSMGDRGTNQTGYHQAQFAIPTNTITTNYTILFPNQAFQGPVYFTVSGASTNPIITLSKATNEWVIPISDITTALTTGTTKNYFYAPASGMTIVGVRLTLVTASSSGIPTVDINEAGTTILSTKLTVDANELDSNTAATAAVISDSAIAANALITFDIDVAGTAAAGAQVHVLWTVP
jgi:hypothetical protein